MSLHVCGTRDYLCHTETAEKTLVQATHQIIHVDISIANAQTHINLGLELIRLCPDSLSLLPSQHTELLPTAHLGMEKAPWKSTISNPGLKLQTPE